MTQLDTALLKQAEYARHRHCSREAVRKAVASGRITTFGPDKLIDPELADAQWQRNTRARVRSASADNTIPAANVPPVAAVSVSYDEARRRRELAEASMAEMKQEELRGELIRVEAVKTALARVFSMTRDTLLQIPARLAPLLAADTDPANVQNVLYTEIHQALQHLASADAGIAKPESDPS